MFEVEKILTSNCNRPEIWQHAHESIELVLMIWSEEVVWWSVWVRNYERVVCVHYVITYGNLGVKVDTKLEQSSLYLVKSLADKLVIVQPASICAIKG